MGTANQKLVESMIINWIKKAEFSGELKHNSFNGKKLQTRGFTQVRNTLQMGRPTSYATAN